VRVKSEVINTKNEAWDKILGDSFGFNESYGVWRTLHKIQKNQDNKIIVQIIIGK
jgi:hypothetical protein